VAYILFLTVPLRRQLRSVYIIEAIIRVSFRGAGRYSSSQILRYSLNEGASIMVITCDYFSGTRECTRNKSLNTKIP